MAGNNSGSLLLTMPRLTIEAGLEGDESFTIRRLRAA
jgi:hypothetical protein